MSLDMIRVLWGHRNTSLEARLALTYYVYLEQQKRNPLRFVTIDYATR